MYNHAEMKVSKVASLHLSYTVKDPHLRRQLTPKYLFGCKTPAFSNGYLSTLKLSHVHVHDTQIENVKGKTIQCTNGNKQHLDVSRLFVCLFVRFIQVLSHSVHNEPFRNKFHNGAVFFPDAKKNVSVILFRD